MSELDRARDALNNYRRQNNVLEMQKEYEEKMAQLEHFPLEERFAEEKLLDKKYGDIFREDHRLLTAFVELQRTFKKEQHRTAAPKRDAPTNWQKKYDPGFQNDFDHLRKKETTGRIQLRAPKKNNDTNN